MRRLPHPGALSVLLVASLAAACSAEPSATTTSMASTTSTTSTAEGSSVVNPLPDRDADSTCPPGTTPNLPGPPAHPRPRRSADTAWGAPYVMHDELGLVITIAAEADGFVTWGFDVCTNTWDRLRPRHEPDVDLGRWGTRLVYDADADLVVAFPGEDPTEVWVYSGDDNTWTEQPMTEPQPEPRPANLGDAVYEPGSGDILLRDSRSTRLWAYAVESNLWTEVVQNGFVPTEDGRHSLMTWDTAFDRLVLTLLAGVGETWVFDPGTGNPWVGMVGRPPDLNTSYFESGGEGVFDASVGKTIVFSDGLLGLYDLDDDIWEWRAHGSFPGWPGTQDSGPLARLGHTLVYDPVNLRVVLLGGNARYEDDWRVGDDVWALDLREGRWVELLAATG